MSNDKTNHILARLEVGFRTDSAHLKELEQDLAATLERARHFGKKDGSSEDWNTHWHQQWDNVQGVLHRIRVLVNEMDASITSNDRDRFKKALAAWDAFQSEDARLVAALSAIRAQASGLNVAVRKDWNLLAGTLESHLETIHACAQALRIKLELLKEHSREAVEQLVQDILSKLPDRTHADGMDAEYYEQEYRKAATELEQERHKFLGFVDVVKGLLLWVETTEERGRKNLSLIVDKARIDTPTDQASSLASHDWTPLNVSNPRNYQARQPMLQSIKQLYGNKLGASDGDLGQVKDFYFDDHNWAVRYLVADTGTWLASRQVLLSPHAFDHAHLAGKILTVNLTRKQIEDSPSIESHKPVSRQYEEDYYRYYAWPYYWQGDGLWGVSGFPILELPMNPPPMEQAVAIAPPRESADAHLRSTQAVKGYHLQANDGITGHVSDFMMDDKSWAIHQLVIKTGHRFSGHEVVIPAGKVDRISYEDSTVFVNMTKEEVEQSPAHPLAPIGAAA